MKRSEINLAIQQAKTYFVANGWHILPHFKWDVTDFGLGDFQNSGLVLINLCEEVEYCEKLMYARKNMITPAHFHEKKKEDIICRTGMLELQLWESGKVPRLGNGVFEMKINGHFKSIKSGEKILLKAGERITIQQGIWHAFWPASEECIIGEVSTANDDLNDNFFNDSNIGRYPDIEEDEKPILKLLSDK